MLPEDRLLCLLTRQKFTPDHARQAAELCRSHPMVWNQVFYRADEHGVAPLAYVNLLRSQAAGVESSEAALFRFKRAYVQNILVKKDTAGILNQALALLSQKNLEVMLVKGAALALVIYDQPWYTVSLDVDLVIGAPGQPISNANRAQIDHFFGLYNNEAAKHRVIFEYDFGAHHDFTMNGVLTVDSAQVWQEAAPVRCGDWTVRVMRPEDLLIAACINACRKRYFRLKALLDAATIIEKSPDLDWPLLCRRAADWKCSAIVYTTLWLTDRMLGCRLPAGALKSLKVSPLRAGAIRSLAETLLAHNSLERLTQRSEAGIGERKLSQSLLLTYLGYTPRQFMLKLRQVNSQPHKIAGGA